MSDNNDLMHLIALSEAENISLAQISGCSFWTFLSSRVSASEFFVNPVGGGPRRGTGRRQEE